MFVIGVNRRKAKEESRGQATRTEQRSHFVLLRLPAHALIETLVSNLENRFQAGGRGKKVSTGLLVFFLLWLKLMNCGCVALLCNQGAAAESEGTFCVVLLAETSSG